MTTTRKGDPAFRRFIVRLGRRLHLIKPPPPEPDWRAILLRGEEAKCPPGAFRKLAGELRAAGDLAGADAISTRGVLLHPDDLWLAMEHAVIAADDPEAASSRWRRVLDLGGDKASAKAFKNLADYHMELGDFQSAEALVRRGVALYPEDFYLEERLGKISMAAGFHGRAAEQWLELIAHHPEAHGPAVYLRIGAAYGAEGLHRRAEEILAAGVLRFPEDAGLADALAQLRPPEPAEVTGNFTAHLFRDRVEPFGQGSIALPGTPAEADVAMLDFAECVPPRQAGEADVFAIFGDSAPQDQKFARRLAAGRGKPLLCLERGYAGSLVICPDTPYFDATRPTFLEERLNSDDYQLTGPQLERAAKCAARFVTPGGTRILLVDQALADRSVDLGLGGALAFERMLETALAIADRELVVLLHPAGYLRNLLPDPLPPRVTLAGADPLAGVDRVFVCTSPLGFEALLAGREVDCFASPFYAGWGITRDHAVVPRRKRRRSAEEIFHLVYLEMSRYFRAGVCEFEDAIHLPMTEEIPRSVQAGRGQLRILIILPSERHGASGRYIQTLAESLGRLGCEVMVLAEGKCPPKENGVTWLGLDFEGVRLAAPVREAVTEFRPDIVYENGVRTRAQRAALEIMVLTGARLAMQSEDDDVQVYETHHGPAAAEILTLLDKPQLTADDIARFLTAIDLNHSLGVLLDPRHDRWVEPVTRALCYRLASLHTAIWHPFAARLAREYEVPTLVVPPVAAAADFQRLTLAAGEREEILARREIGPERVVFFIGGALYTYSDEYAVFLDALNRLADRSIALVVASGRSSLPIARMARERLLPEIAFADIGRANDSDYMEMLKACDVVCSPGMPDTFNRYRLPSRLVKAMAMAKPVLTCRHGFGESLEHNVNGFLMDGTDPAGWADAIAACLDADRRREVGNAGQDFARRHFDSDRVSAELKTAFDALMAAPARRLADGIVLSPPRSGSAGLARLRTARDSKLRGRHHATMQGAILAIAAESSRLDTVVHIGAGEANEFQDYCRMGASKVLLIEALPGPVAALREMVDADGRIGVVQAVVAGDTGSASAFVVTNARADGEAREQLWLSPPSQLLEGLPALRISRECPVTTITLAAVCEGMDLSAANNLLVLELGGAEAAALAAAPPALLRGFRWIALRACDPPLADGGTTPAEAERILGGAGFEAVATPPDHAEPDALLLFRRAKLTLPC